MDPLSNAASSSKSAGIPRLSKLPQLRQTPAGAVSGTTNSTNGLSKLRPAASVEALRKKFSQPLLNKKPSLNSIARPSSITPVTRAPPPRYSNAAPNSLSRPTSVNTSQDKAFKKPIGRPQSRQLSNSISHKATQFSLQDVSQEDDTLGELDGFRSSSQLGFRDSGYQGSERDKYAQESEPTLKPRRSRPSLSDRTVESLSNVPATGPRRRKSSFFTPDGSVGASSSRPGSVTGNANRPGTSDGIARQASNLPSTPMAQKQTNLPLRGSTTGQIGKRLSSGTFAGNRSISGRPPSVADSTPSKLARPASTLTPPTTRPAVTTPMATATKASQPRPTPRKPPARPVAAVSTPTPTRTSNPVTKRASAMTATSPTATKLASKPSSSSAALREQIARAKAAKKAAAAPKEGSPEVKNDFNFDFDLPSDPFNQVAKPGGGALRKRVDAARSDGRLNIAAMGLSKVPEAVLTMYDFNANGDSSIAWGEVVDLVRFNAADNDIEQIADDVFPDLDPQSVDIDDDTPGPQFSGVEILDFHGNLLREVPVGLRRLQRLTTLNLSRNRLTCDAFDVIAQVTQIKDLRLADNALDGDLPESIASLTALTNLELQGNMLSSLPDCLRELVNLHVLNVGNNQLKSLPMTSLCAVPLREIIAPKNMLHGDLFGPDVSGHPTLQVLIVASNSLSGLSESQTLNLPAIRTLNISANRINALPDMSTWSELTSLLASENNLSDLPVRFTSLQKLRNADFTSNDIAKLDPLVATMDSLETLLLAANPLRERKYLSMSADQLKKDLRQRMSPSLTGTSMASGEAKPNNLGDVEDLSVDAEGMPIEEHPWSPQPPGTLNLPSKELSQLDPCLFNSFISTHKINRLNLQFNLFESIPTIISTTGRTLTTLNLSHNAIAILLSESLELPSLKDLCLAHNKITSKTLSMLATHLDAPQLNQLDLTYNRLTGSLPVLRSSFPLLSVLSAAENGIEAVSPEALEGLRNVDLRNNSIEKLDPRIGLLVGTLSGLEVEGNRFRVPSYNVLKMGTDKVLSWLRDKIPVTEREGFEHMFD